MIRHRHTLRVRYAETDQMGYVYYGNYAAYFEVGRTEMVRALGCPYAPLERDHGVLMPVVELHVNYKRPARYDDALTVITELRTLPELRVRFDHEIRFQSESGADVGLCVTGHVELVFISASTFRPVRPPRLFADAVAAVWPADGVTELPFTS